jgi:hypothetical protein
VLACFRQAYWIALRTIDENVDAAGLTEKALLDEFQKSVKAARLLGEVTKPEAGTVVLFTNALSRFRELGLVVIEATGRGGRDKKISRGPSAAEAGAIIDRLRLAEDDMA